ncbi:membrane-spanning 4-domains subfamily A member 4D-like isoform 2-T3 [Vipera latastei]
MDSVVVMGPESLPSATKTDLPVPVKKFYQGEPLALGIAQIFIGMIGIIFGMLINIINEHIFYLIVFAPYWSGILYIISGSLAVAAAWNPRMPLVQSMLAMNVLSTVAAGLGLASLFATFSLPYLYSLNLHCNHLKKEIQEKCDQLEICITISVASFGCKMLCRNTFPEKVVILYQNVPPASVEERPPLNCKLPAIHP